MAKCIATLAVAVGCAHSARVPVSAGTGPSPELPPPSTSVIPTVKIADPKGWKTGESPVAPAGLAVRAFARNLDHPRWLYVLPNGDVLVAETNAPADRSDDNKGIKGWFFRHFQKKAGAAVPSANRITLLRDSDGDGVADTRTVLIDHLYSPFGTALVGDTLYIANSNAATKSFSFRSRRAGRTALRSMCSPSFSMAMAMRAAGRLASPSIDAAPCSLPMTLATSSGG